MKICFLAPANNYHTKKWCKYFTDKGHEVHVISFIDDKIDNTYVHYIDSNVDVLDSDIKKIKYLFKYKKIRRLIKSINPDIVNAHYATSYGMVAALSNIDYILSVWGSDVYRFPNKSIIHKLYFKYLINKPKIILSTSNCMKKELSKYTKKSIYVTPFGVDMNLFKPLKKNNNIFTIGTIKSIKEIYGIKYIIDSVKIIKSIRPDIKLKVNIAGIGDKLEEYKKYAKDNNIDINWLGFINEKEVVDEFNKMDVAIFPSLYESFGVSAIEAQACGIPIIISNAEGLMEVTLEDFRILIKDMNAINLANAIIYLYDNPKKREDMSIKEREYVLSEYEYNKCFNNIEKIFKKKV